MEGAVKLRDGVFFGDQAAAQDIEFVIANKVTRIVNCAGRQVANHFESIGVEYLRFDWLDNDACTILDPRDETIETLRAFVIEPLERGESVLVHSQRGQSRCITVLAAYLMRQYRWTVNKALLYVQSRRADIAIKPAFHRQLLSYERRLCAVVPLSNDWTQPTLVRPAFSRPTGWQDYDVNEDIVMCNTYLNSKAEKPAFSIQPSRSVQPGHSARRRLVWSDGHLDDRARLERGSDASGNTYLRQYGSGPKSILKKRLVESVRSQGQKAQEDLRRTLGGGLKLEGSPASTAASTPQAAHVTPLVTSMRSPLVANVPPPLRLGLRSITPSRQADIRPPSPLVRGPVYGAAPVSLRPASPFSQEHVRPPSPLSRIYANVGSDQERGRPLHVSNAFSNKPNNHYIRPPSPMMRSVLQPQQGLPVRKLLGVGSSIRPPSPARPEREPQHTVTRTIGYAALPAPRPIMTGSFRRAPSPMTAALQGPLRPQSAPQWRT